MLSEPPPSACCSLRVCVPLCVQLSSKVGSLNQQVESVAATSAAAVAELSVKLDGLQSDVGQMKQLLLALLERQQ